MCQQFGVIIVLPPSFISAQSEPFGRLSLSLSRLLSQRAPALENYITPEEWQSARTKCLIRVRARLSQKRSRMLIRCSFTVGKD